MLVVVSVITKRRIGLSLNDIEDSVNQCDVNRIHGEYAELLLKFMPTKDEVNIEPSDWFLKLRLVVVGVAFL